MNLFTYGTLMFPEVWDRIAIGDFPSQSAVLHGYEIFRVRDALYPGIIRSQGKSSIRGLLYQELDEDTLFELDTYESSFYERRLVLVSTADGAELECFAYVVPDGRRTMLTNEPWDAEHFCQHHLEHYLNGGVNTSNLSLE